ncbi:DUF1983 domain-containing protein [Xenorhabdus stockiae]|uniref:DUF1983 domain-containing protein n=1 Tax=Xenorhabdus stockiae TaxID=351614 RepID=UPI0040631F8C
MKDGENKAEITRLDRVFTDEKIAVAQQINEVKAELIGDIKASVRENEKAIAKVDSALAESEKRTQVQFEDQSAIISEKATAVFDITGNGYAIKDIGAGINYQGQFYKAGMVIGAEVKNGKVETHFGVRANQFTVVNPSSGKLDPVFVIKNGQAFFNQVFIDKASINGADIKDASITMAKIADGIQSDNWPNGGWNLPKNGAFEMKGTAGGVRVALDHTGLAVFDGRGVLRVKVGRI